MRVKSAEAFEKCTEFSEQAKFEEAKDCILEILDEIEKKPKLKSELE